MAFFILMRGPMGIGKSTISSLLAKKLNAIKIDVDSILQQNGLDKVSEDEECIPAKNFIKADDIVFPEVKKALYSGRNVVFDACFYHKEHIDHIISNLPYDHFIFTLKAPLEDCIARNNQRKKRYPIEAVQAVYSLVTRFDSGIVIETKGKSIDQTLSEIISYLPK